MTRGRLNAGEIAGGPPLSACPIGPTQPHVVILSQEAQRAIQSGEARRVGTHAELTEKDAPSMLSCPFRDRGQCRYADIDTLAISACPGEV